MIYKRDFMLCWAQYTSMREITFEKHLVHNSLDIYNPIN